LPVGERADDEGVHVSDPTGSAQSGPWRPGDPPDPASPYAPATLGSSASGSNPAGRTALALGIVALVGWLAHEAAYHAAFAADAYNPALFQVLRVGGWVRLILALAALGTGIYALRQRGPRGAAGVGTGIALTLVVIWVFLRLSNSLALYLW
jgi:hypothetical protein